MRHKKQRKCPLVKYIVVHSTGTRTDMLIKEMDHLPYHFLITPGGRLINLKQIGHSERYIHIALLGGLDKDGRHTDTRTEDQNETLFTSLILLTEQFDRARIIGADERYPYGFANPGFDIKSWLSDYMPSILFAAA